MPAKLFSIAPGSPFLRTLAEGVLDGRILPGMSFRGDPLALAGLTIYLPTRRAVRALGEEFARALGGSAAILPAIRTLGDEDPTALFDRDGGAKSLEAVIDPTERRMLVARFVRQWKTRLREAAIADLHDGEEHVVPASSADALWLACDLLALLDEAETEGTTLRDLTGLAPDSLAGWWQLTQTFLAILTEHWPAVLAERGRVDEVAARNRWLRAEAEAIGSGRRPGPVIVAGSTATAPAMVALMRAVANHPSGAVVLPGLDRHMDEAGFDAVHTGTAIGAGSAPGHPQYALKRILQGMLLPRGAVDHFAPPDGATLALREAFLSDALRPASTTDAWGEPAHRHPAQALDGLSLIEAENEHEEALAIACAMRDALTDPAATVALTTPDRSLARRVCAELERFNIAANDSAGRPLAATPPGTLMALALACALRPGDPVALVALLKHPLVRLGHVPGDTRRAARAIEIMALRGNVGVADAARLAALFAKARADAEPPAEETGDTAAAKRAASPGVRVTRAVRLVSRADRDLAAEVAQRLEDALRPLIELRDADPSEIGPQAVALTQALEALARDEEGDPKALYATETGRALADFLREMVACVPTGFSFSPRELPDVVEALVAPERVRPRGGLSGRAFVWGALESRLQHVDTMILGGLNEGTWPHRAVSDAFLSRLMRAEIKLEPPERLIGLAAHDIQMALGMPRVVMSRSMRVDGAPTIASRWLQRILTLAGTEGAGRLRAEGATFLAHARRLDEAAEGPGAPARATRPAPVPPPEKRPKRYSVTEVERLVRDPYAVHASRVLKLEPFPDLLRNPGAADRGNLFHAILAEFAAQDADPGGAGAETRLLTVAAEHFEREKLPKEVEAVWWPRMETLAANYCEWERGRAHRIAKRLVETRGEHHFADIDTAIRGFADRIDVATDGSLEIIDFKTGTNPSVRQARVLLSPQLPLEGAMAKLGAFAETGEGAKSVADLSYVRLRERELYEETLSYDDRRTGARVTGDDLADAALEKFRGLAAHYAKAGTPFPSRARPFMAGDFSGDYDHLARAREWSVGSDDGDGGE
ncbi:double-strand break repair protein AddB [Aureimonas leprariae]|uniref:Double-strand break repair protein AddB n=1 Tax=Plantimonas leprariae TaxID=2615207 RepID=A0A7V7PTB5_9HYPH|nr:double-strand break repair protein AddB [Aureimonas leprariae]KAB0682896.1 double-strand break repair protein AddB [Aureimonas leprariae]